MSILSKMLNVVLSTPTHVRNTLKHLSDADIASAMDSYAKSIPGVTIVGKMAPKAATYAKSAFAANKAGTAAKVSLNALSRTVSSASNWWLAPAKNAASTGVKAAKTAATSKLAIPIAKTAGITGAVLVADHALAKLAKSTGIVEFWASVFNKERAKQEFGQSRNAVQTAHDLMIAGPIKRAWLQVIHGKSVKGGKN